MYNVLYIFVEGDDDERFFCEIFLPVLRKKYDDVKIIKYAQKPKKFDYLEKFIRSILKMKHSYILVVDINDSPCITAKKQEVQNKLKNVELQRILVVVREIESWYLAGLNIDSAKKLGIKKIPKTTENITKEDFYSMMPKKFSRIDIMTEILKNFSIQIAKQKNKSLKYCIEKLIQV